MVEFLKNSKYLKFEKIKQDIRGTTLIKGDRVANIFCGYDIEVSTYSPDIAISYIQMIGIGDQTIYTRNIVESITLLEKIGKIVKKECGGKLLVLVHNLSYEYQHIKLILKNIQKVFARDIHDVIEIVTDNLIFRCTYAFTRMSLELLANTYTDVKKVKGELDYNRLRHPLTPLHFREYYYCFYDIEVLRRFYDLEFFPNWLKKRNIPLTSTGKVRVAMRQALRKYCINNNLRKTDYTYYLQSIQLSEELYNVARKAFWGAYTHADWRCVDRIIECDSYDIGSSYIYCLLCEEYPMGRFYKVRPNLNFIEDRCCLMEVELFNVKPKRHHHPLGYNKMLAVSGVEIDNGRIIAAQYLKFCCCDVDFNLIKEYYSVESYNINSMYVSEKGKLPRFLRCEMMEWFRKKNELKNVKGRELEYQNRKEYLNSIYGMMVEDILKNDIVFNGKLLEEKKIDNIPKRLKDVQSQKSRFTAYQWGVYVTAYARWNLFHNIINVIENGGGHCVYSDTDSGKADVRGLEQQFSVVNNNIELRVKTELKNLGLPEEWSYDLGQVDKENKNPLKLKTLGCKRYCYRGDNTQKAVVSGMKNIEFQRWLNDNNIDMFDAFQFGLNIPEEYTGKLTSHYNENVSRETLLDYLGNEWTGNVYSSISLVPQPYKMKLVPEYMALINTGRRGTS